MSRDDEGDRSEDGEARADEVVENDDGAVAVDGDEHDDGTDPALLSRLRVIEDQPLNERASALSELHDELRARLEAGDAPRPSA